jgi:membrane protein DedA with SNARE-associated domain
MMEDLLEWLQHTEGPAAYAVLGLAAMAEYVFPPFPGDTITLTGVFLAVGAGYHVAWVYAALNVGAVIGGMGAYGVGRLVAARRLRRPPRFLRTQQLRQAVNTVLDRFERHGSWYLALNRFLPALRAVFFIAAGMARLPAWKVAVYGAVSAALWNGLLLGLGWLLGDNLEQLESILRTYSAVVIAVVVAVLAGLALRWWWRRRRDPEG